MKDETVADIVLNTINMDRGVTYRVYPGGMRPLLHRWHFSKIRGAVPLRDAWVELIYDTSPLLKILLSKGVKEAP